LKIHKKTFFSWGLASEKAPFVFYPRNKQEKAPKKQTRKSTQETNKQKHKKTTNKKKIFFVKSFSLRLWEKVILSLSGPDSRKGPTGSLLIQVGLQKRKKKEKEPTPCSP